MSDRQKLAEDTQAVLLESANTIEALSRTNVKLAAERNAFERELKIMKLARTMEERGLSADLDFDEKCAQLSRADDEKLATMEQAIELSAGGFRLDSANELTAPAVGQSSGAALEAYITSNSAYNS